MTSIEHPSEELVVEALKHLNAASQKLFACQVSKCTTTLKNEAGYEIPVGTVRKELTSRVVQALGTPEVKK